jgi:hypothetical protein
MIGKLKQAVKNIFNIAESNIITRCITTAGFATSKNPNLIVLHAGKRVVMRPN